MRIHPDDRLDHFTDRADEKAAYELLWAPRARHRVLCFGGLSGIGKSTLLDYLQERHQPRRRAVKINFADPHLQVGYLFRDQPRGRAPMAVSEAALGPVPGRRAFRRPRWGAPAGAQSRDQRPSGSEGRDHRLAPVGLDRQRGAHR